MIDSENEQFLLSSKLCTAKFHTQALTSESFHIAEWLRLLLMNTSCPVNDQPSCNFMLFNTFRELEGKYINYLSVLDGRKVVPVGPLVQEIVNENKHTEIMEWLDSKDESSTVFVSFGS
ncbi:hypothetical protein ACSBR2_007265 [Camellia fascicularis]